MRDLTDHEQALLAFEARTWRYRASRDEAIIDTFGVSPTRYQQQLNALLDDPAALAHDPVLVNRLRRVRDERKRARRLAG
jgi:hypothetical protein